MKGLSEDLQRQRSAIVIPGPASKKMPTAIASCREYDWVKFSDTLSPKPAEIIDTLHNTSNRGGGSASCGVGRWIKAGDKQAKIPSTGVLAASYIYSFLFFVIKSSYSYDSRFAVVVAIHLDPLSGRGTEGGDPRGVCGIV